MKTFVNPKVLVKLISEKNWYFKCPPKSKYEKLQLRKEKCVILFILCKYIEFVFILTRYVEDYKESRFYFKEFSFSDETLTEKQKFPLASFHNLCGHQASGTRTI